MNITSKQLGFGVLILLGLILAFAPVDQMRHKPIPADELIAQLNNASNFVQPDELAHWIIDKDPSFQVIDIRSAEDHKKYHIPGNTHIPFEKLLDDETEELIDPQKMLILASNGNTRAGQAWILMKQKGYEEVYILAGGLNNWVNVFASPKAPNEASTDDEVFTFQFRKAAGPEMMGTAVAKATDGDTKITPPKPVKRKRRAKVNKADEGC